MGVLLRVESGPDAVLTLDGPEIAVLNAEASTYIETSEIYTGPYAVTPKAYDVQILGTAQKLLTDNVTVYEVPYYETPNASGDTVFIASEV